MTLQLTPLPRVSKRALISDCGSYRYGLFRGWGGGRSITFVGLNPSTADAHQDDPTIRRCIGFARSWGYSRLFMGNLFAYRATKPADLFTAADPVGPETDEQLGGLFMNSDTVVACWGACWKNKAQKALVQARVLEVAQVARTTGHELHAIATTREGHPRHPLYLRQDLTLSLWEPV